MEHRPDLGALPADLGPTLPDAAARGSSGHWSVGQVADLFGVSVRTLHHYDRIGLLTPGGRSPAGYRLYDHDDLVRLQHIVVYRRLEFGLDEIGELLTAGPQDVGEHLRRQRAAVQHRMTRLRDLVGALDRAWEKIMENQPLSTAEMRELFGDGFDESHAAQAQERWGDTEPWAQSQQRTAGYTRADWEAVKVEQDAVNAAFVAAMDAGEPADGPAAMDAAEAHRRHITERFYDLGYPMHRGLADMYLADPRFTATYEALHEGLARYVHDAIHANADRHDTH